MPDLILTADTLELPLEISGDRYASGGGTSNPLANLTIISSPLEVVLEINGEVLSRTLFPEALEVFLEISGRLIMSGAHYADALEVGFEISGDAYLKALKSNWVVWSKIGDIRIITDRSNEAGERPMPWQGWAYKALKLGNQVIVYGSGGVAALVPVAEPTMTYGLKMIRNTGVQNPGAVAGSEFVHYFVSKDAELWRLTGEGASKLGYKEFLDPLVASAGRLILLYDDSKERLYISDGVTGYIFGNGLGGGFNLLTGISRQAVAAPAALVRPVLDVVTHTIDFKIRGIKSVTFVQVSAQNPEILRVRAKYKYKTSDSWKDSPWIRCNDDGSAYLNVAGTEFQIEVKQDVAKDNKLHYINVHYKIPDRRARRGALRPMEGSE